MHPLSITIAFIFVMCHTEIINHADMNFHYCFSDPNLFRWRKLLRSEQKTPPQTELALQGDPCPTQAFVNSGSILLWA